MNVIETFWRRPKDLPFLPTDHLFARLWARKSARFGFAAGAALLIFVVLYPLFAPFAPNEQIAGAKLLAPNAEHLLGTDQFGRDLLARVASGGARSLGAAVLVLSLIVLFGIGLGTVFGLAGGILDAAAMRVIDVFLAIPPLVLALAVVGVLGPGFENLLLAILVSSLAFYTRLARSYVLASGRRKDVVTARLAGIGWAKIAAGHIFPRVFAQMLIVATLDLGGVIVSLASLSFLGLGAAPPDAEWGAMLAEARSYFTFAPWLLAAPAGAIFWSVMAANLIGNALRDETK